MGRAGEFLKNGRKMGADKSLRPEKSPRQLYTNTQGAKLLPYPFALKNLFSMRFTPFFRIFLYHSTHGKICQEENKKVAFADKWLYNGYIPIIRGEIHEDH